MVEAVPHRSLRVVEEDRVHTRPIGEIERLAGLEAVMRKGAGKDVQGHREEWRREQAVQGLLRARSVEIAAIGVDRPFRVEDDRLEERQTRRVVEMQMAQQEVDLFRHLLAVMQPAGIQARAGIDDEQARAAADLQARGVAAELDIIRPANGRGTADAPEA